MELRNPITFKLDSKTIVIKTQEDINNYRKVLKDKIKPLKEQLDSLDKLEEQLKFEKIDTEENHTIFKRIAKELLSMKIEEFRKVYNTDKYIKHLETIMDYITYVNPDITDNDLSNKIQLYLANEWEKAGLEAVTDNDNDIVWFDMFATSLVKYAIYKEYQ